MTIQEKETQFFSLVSVIAGKYGLQIKIEPDTQNIDLVGEATPLEVVACAAEIVGVAKGYEDIVA